MVKGRRIEPILMVSLIYTFLNTLINGVWASICLLASGLGIIGIDLTLSVLLDEVKIPFTRVRWSLLCGDPETSALMLVHLYGSPITAT